MREWLRIAVTVDPYIPVPPRLYGGIERVVDFLVRGLAERGHEVTLLAHPDSRVPAGLIPYGVPPHIGRRPRLAELWQVGSVLWRRRSEWDLVHSFGRLAALLPILSCRSLPKVQSYQRDPVPWNGVRRAVRLAGSSLRFTACSTNVYRDRPVQGRWGGDWRTIFNGVDLSLYEFASVVAPDAPLVFLGRLEAIKGVHHAIAIAKIAGRRLVIAGNRLEGAPGAEYFHREIEPHIDGHHVRYVGPVDDQAKNALLGRAAALLMPVDWEEPFGIVMAEALACGTPVIGFARGAVPEVVRDGVNGFLCASVSEAAAAVHRLDRLERAAARRDCEARFADRVIVDAYEAVYREAIACRAAWQPSPSLGAGHE
jgi:glycosyltransferase involved in cell wall biosynthesis